MQIPTEIQFVHGIGIMHDMHSSTKSKVRSLTDIRYGTICIIIDENGAMLSNTLTLKGITKINLINQNVWPIVQLIVV